MKIGDLVQVKLGTGVYQHRKFFGEVGIVLCLPINKMMDKSFAMVYLLGKQRRFFLDHLEVVSESR